MNKTKKNISKIMRENPILVLLSFFIIILFGMLLVTIFWQKGGAGLDVLVVPTDAKVLVGGEEFENGIYQGMSAGVYDVQISREGFNVETRQIELKDGEMAKLYVALGGGDYSDTDKELMRIIDEYNNEVAAKKYIEKYPITKVLPIVVEGYTEGYAKYVHFRIDGGRFDNCEGEFCVRILDMTGGNYQYALKEIKNKGYNPEDYVVIYEDASGGGKAF